jgi:hypothetical protein
VKEGILYVALGDQFVAEAEEASQSARRHMPDVPVVMLGEDDFPLVTRAEFARLVEHPNPPASQWAWYNKILALTHSPFAHTLFLDTDTRVTAPLYDLLRITRRVDIAAAYTPTRSLLYRALGPNEWWLPSHNTGVMAYGAVKSLFMAWLRYYIERFRSEQDYSDQSVFELALHETTTSYASLPEEFNYRVSMPAKLDGLVKVLHGRDHAKLAKTEWFVNRYECPRLVMPEVGMLWTDEGDYWWSSYDDPEPVRLRREQVMLRLSRRL